MSFPQELLQLIAEFVCVDFVCDYLTLLTDRVNQRTRGYTHVNIYIDSDGGTLEFEIQGDDIVLFVDERITSLGTFPGDVDLADLQPKATSEALALVLRSQFGNPKHPSLNAAFLEQEADVPMIEVEDIEECGCGRDADEGPPKETVIDTSPLDEPFSRLDMIELLDDIFGRSG